MKITCACGAAIPDGDGDSPTRAHLIPDAVWDAFWMAIDRAIEQCGPSAAEREAACMHLRRLQPARGVWQCSSCARLYVDGPGDALIAFRPEDEGGAARALAPTSKA